MNDTNGTNGTSTAAKLLWKHASPASTPMSQFLHEVNKTYGQQLSDYRELHKWSIANTNDFWQSTWDFVGIRHQGQASRVINRAHYC